jgi:hypothetical protein
MRWERRTLATSLDLASQLHLDAQQCDLLQFDQIQAKATLGSLSLP